MKRNKRKDRVETPAYGQAGPLPLPQEGDARMTPLPTPSEAATEMTPLPSPVPAEQASDAAAPSTAKIEDDVGSTAKSKVARISRDALDFYVDRSRFHYTRLGNLGAALSIAGRELKERTVARDGVFLLRPETSIERYLRERVSGEGRSIGAKQEPLDVAEKRRAYDEAARSGDAGAMTRTANELLRAVESSRARGGAHEAQDAFAGERGRDPISEVLAPGGEAGQLMRDGKRGAYRISEAAIGETSKGLRADSGALLLNDDQARIAANILKRIAPEERVAALRKLGDEFGKALADQVTKHVASESTGGELDGELYQSVESLRSVDGHALEESPSRVEGAKYVQAGWWEDFKNWIWDHLPGRKPPRTDPEDDSWMSDYDDPDAAPMGPEVWRRPPDDPLGPPGDIIDNPAFPVDRAYQPDAWRWAKKPQSHKGKVLVDAKELSKAQYENLTGRWNDRRWMSPTGAPPAGHERLPGTASYDGGYGYFGARRNDINPDRQYHGALDFPRNPNDPILKMPTQARFLGLLHDPQNGYAARFDLGDGIVLVLWHIVPSEELLQLDRARLAGRPSSRILAMGHPLGIIDRRRDHVHMQIEVAGGRFNGEPVRGFVVDPTPFF